MTTLDPTHNPLRDPKGRHAQAIHKASEFPDDLPEDDTLSIDEEGHHTARVKREARHRVRAQMPPIPDLRFEQSYLLSIRPFLTPAPTKRAVEKRGLPSSAETGAEHLTVQGAEDDEVFHWGRQVNVNWGMVSWITLRDQLLSPLVQGALWGWAGIAWSASSLYISSALYPASHVGKGRIGGGPGGTVSQAGGGEAVGEPEGWWRSWVKSWGGGVQTAAA